MVDFDTTPLLYGIDAVHGHSTVRGATLFPHNCGLGAANDARLVELVGRVTAIEMAATVQKQMKKIKHKKLKFRFF